MNFDTTALACGAFQRALEETRRLQHASVRAEHVLLGLLQLGVGAASAAFDAEGADRARIRQRLINALPAPELPPNAGEYPYHPSGVALIQACIEEADRADHTLSTGGILLAALHLSGASLAEAVAEGGADCEALSRRLRRGPGDS